MKTPLTRSCLPAKAPPGSSSAWQGAQAHSPLPAVTRGAPQAAPWDWHAGLGSLHSIPWAEVCGHLVEEAVWNGARARSQHPAAFGFYAEHWSPPPQPPGREIACTLLHVVGQLEADFFPLEWGNPEQAIPKPSHDSCTQPPPCQPRWGN